jgi:hypothetical protein
MCGVSAAGGMAALAALKDVRRESWRLWLASGNNLALHCLNGENMKAANQCVCVAMSKAWRKYLWQWHRICSNG